MRTPESIREKVSSILQLPALPSIAMEIVEMVDNPKTSASKLGKVIASDQALTAKVLKIANSPFYGFPRRISTVEFAIIVLGYDALKEIVIGISLISALQRKSDLQFDARSFWDHAVTTGVVARRLARDTGYRVSGEVFVAGLLHDMGISIMHRFFRTEYRQILEAMQSTGKPFLELELEILGATHADIGGWLAERWNLPSHLVEALALHHTPGRATKNQDLVAIIHCADVFANKLDVGVSYDCGLEIDLNGVGGTRLGDPELLARSLEGYRALLDTEIKDAIRAHSQP
jgi:HD-like signal output (HDOD) protein